ncbi:COP9 signalosome complex subunit 8 [Schistosoma japonicum]|uniref:COP9 signalosome complex subunit 8 n=1 Tax=Schistosoma japonicum TaxID=6182 RepID=C1LH15_SCHJA|nr:COP9 signalosome complex subunit 8 [Schistosoma japonicum]CAX73993.1 Zinc finger, C2H2-type domain-containing protein [Schistosoma japonicum]
MSEDDSAIDEQLAEMLAFELGLDTVNFDSKSCPTSLANPSPTDFYLQYMGLYLIKSDIVSAKFLYKRMPPKIKEQPSIKCLWNLGRLLWRNDVKSFFFLSSQVLSDPKHPDILIQMVKQIRDKQLDLITDLCGRAYSRICIEFLCDYLNVSSKDICDLFVNKGWEICSDGRFISRFGETTCENNKIRYSESDTSNNDLLSKLSELMCFMENH